MIDIRVQTADFDVAVEYAALSAAAACVGRQAGAVTMFVGLVRDVSATGGLQGMQLECYPGMTEKALANIVGEAKARWPLLAVRLVHRVGVLAPAEQIVFVGVAASHRAAAFAACEFLMDYLKTRAPFWKREIDAAGVSRWVEQQQDDVARASRWVSSSSGEAAVAVRQLADAPVVPSARRD